MEKRNKTFEDIFQQTLENHRVTPSSAVLKNLKRRLFLRDFFSISYRKFNIVYLSIILISLFTVPTLLTKKNNTPVVSEETNIEFTKDLTNKSNLTNKDEAEKVRDKEELNIIPEKEGESLLKAFYDTDILEGCVPLKIRFKNKAHNADSYYWEFGNGDRSKKSNPVYTYNSPGRYTAKFIVTNHEGDKAEYSRAIRVFSKPESNFNIDIEDSDLTTLEVAFENKSINATGYKWSFGDKAISNSKEPEHVYASFGSYNVSLIAFSDKGCSDTTTRTNKFILEDYRLVFPLQFKPNVANMNNGNYERPENQSFVFYPQNNGVKEYQLSISALNGTKVFLTDDIKQGWNGYVRGRMAPAGSYTYKATGIYPNGKEFSITGKVRLVIDNSYENFNSN